MPCVVQIRTEEKPHPLGHLSMVGTPEEIMQRHKSYRGEVIAVRGENYFKNTLSLHCRKVFAYFRISDKDPDDPLLLALMDVDQGGDPEHPLRYRLKRVRRQYLIDAKPVAEQEIRDAYNPNTAQGSGAWVEFTWNKFKNAIVDRSIIETEVL